MTISWSPPVQSGGEKITSYSVVSDPVAGSTTTSGATTATITGLTNGTPYVFQVAATTVNGTGPPTLSNIVVPGGGVPPSAPIGVVAVARDREAWVSWAAPANPGGSAITGYWVTVTPGGSGQPSKGTSILETGLVNGQTYEFSVEAVNAAGAGPNASSNPVVPSADAGLFDGGAFDAGLPDAAAVDARRGDASSLHDSGVDATTTHDAASRDGQAHEASPRDDARAEAKPSDAGRTDR